MANFGDVLSNISLGALQSVRRNAGDTAFEAYSPSSLYQPLDDTLTALAGLTIAANSLIVGASPSLTVAGAGTSAANGEYTYRGVIGGNPTWNLVGQPDNNVASSIAQSGATATMWSSTGSLLYSASGCTPLPSDGTWSAISGSAPVPTVTASSTLLDVTFAANTFPARASTGDLVAKSITDVALTLASQTTQALMRSTGLGLGTMSTQAASAVAITGGSAVFDLWGFKLQSINTGKLTIGPGDLTADRALVIQVDNANRTLTFTADASIGGTNTGDRPVTIGDPVSGGTVNRLLYENASGNLATGPFWDGTNLGVGITAPSYLANRTLEVTGLADSAIFASESVSGAYLNLYQQNGASYIIAGKKVGTATSNLHIYTGDANRMTILAGGNVGIGTTGPVSKLDVNGTLSLSGVGFADNIGIYHRIFEPAGNGAIFLGNATDPANYYDNSVHYFRSRAGASFHMTINGSGNVGIGTTGPNHNLHVVGSTYTGNLKVGTSYFSKTFSIGNFAQNSTYTLGDLYFGQPYTRNFEVIVSGYFGVKKFRYVGYQSVAYRSIEQNSLAGVSYLDNLDVAVEYDFVSNTKVRIQLKNNDPTLPNYVTTVTINSYTDTKSTGIDWVDVASGTAITPTSVTTTGIIKNDATTSAYMSLGVANNVTALSINSTGNVGIGTTGPTAVLHLKAGTATASTAPLKFTSGVLNTTAEAGAIEFLTDAFYGTITTGAARKQFAFTSDITAAAYTNEMAQDAVGDIFAAGNTVALSYNDLDNIISAEVVDDSITFQYHIENIATGTILGRSTAATGQVEVLSASTARTVLGLGKDDSPTFEGLYVNPIYYSTGTASQSGTTITGVGTVWDVTMRSKSFVFADGTTRTITGRTSNTVLTVAETGTVASQAYQIRYVGLSVDGGGRLFLGTTSTPQGSLAYFYGGATGANIDVRGDANFADQAVLELEGNDYDTVPNSLQLMYYGSAGLGTTCGIANTKLGALIFNEATTAVIGASGTTPLIFAPGWSEKMRLTSTGSLGIGTTPSAFLHVLGTTEQFRAGYDASNYFKATVGSTGGVTFDAVGSGAAFTFSDAVTINGALTLSAQNIVTDTTTGMKIGTGTTQKLSFWNQTPIVQPTTAIAQATYASGTKTNAVYDNDTFDGYTVGQIVKALRNVGILA